MSTSITTDIKDQLINPPDVVEPRSEGENDLLNRITLTFGDNVGDDELPWLDSGLIEGNDQPQSEGA